MKRISLLLVSCLLLLSPLTTHAAAFTSTDDYESYSTGSINGDNGGSGWGGAYSVAGGTCDVSTTVAHGGTKSLHMTSTATSCDVSRSMTAGTTGVQCFWTYAQSVPTGTKGFFPAIFKEGATNRFSIGWGVTGETGNNIGISGDLATYTLIQASPTGATWHQICVDFDQANGRARANIDGGAYTAYVTTSGGSYTQIDTWRWTTADANAVDAGYYIDDVAPGASTLAASIAGLIQAFWIN